MGQEQGVLLVQRWILARLRRQRYSSLADANRAIAGLLASLNRKSETQIAERFEPFDFISSEDKVVVLGVVRRLDLASLSG